MPTRMHHVQSGQIQPQWQGQEPIDDPIVQRGLVFDFGQEGRMLLAVLVTPFGTGCERKYSPG